jgi:uncharacterized membrane protein YoaK (UPF0700 family)
VPLAFAFAAIAGYADAVGYLRYKAFAGMMTGNTVLMGLALFHRAELPVWEYAGVLLIFFSASCLGYGAFRLRCPPLAILLAEAVALILPDVVDSAWSIVPLVIAMGLQNPLATRLGVALNTTFITGDILRFAEGFVGLILRHPERHLRFAIYGIAWLGYATGAALGAAGHRFLSWPLLMPLLVLGYIYVRAIRGATTTISRR